MKILEQLPEDLPTDVFKVDTKILDLAIKMANSTGDWTKKNFRIALLPKACQALLVFLANKKKRRKIDKRKLWKMVIPSWKEQHLAESVLLQAIQRQQFPVEIAFLLRRRVFQPEDKEDLHVKNSALGPLNPFIGYDQLLRAGGRLGAAALIPFDQRYPIVLRGKDENINSLIRHHHLIQGHGGTEVTWNSLRRKYWILAGRTRIKALKAKCGPCQRLKKAIRPQKMAPLPQSRLIPVCPWYVTGVDLAGPYLVRNSGRGSSKRWVMILTCLVSRSVHLEVLDNLTSNSFLLGLARFKATYPFQTAQLVSDQGTNFTHGDKVLKSAIKEWAGIDLSSKQGLNGIAWQYSPAHSGWWMGFCERLVGMMKKIMIMILKEDSLNIETFTTVIKQIAFILNSRPITSNSGEFEGIQALTPFHFLYPSIDIPTTVDAFPPIPDNQTLNTGWREARNLVGEFWVRWKMEYLSALLPRAKWQNAIPNVKLGQLVMVEDRNARREDWKMGRVEKIGQMNGLQVRRIFIRMPNGTTLERASNSVVPLEIID